MKKIFVFLLIMASTNIMGASLEELESRARAIIGQMTLEEKFSQLRNSTPGIERLGIKPYDYWNEALHGVARTGRATVFPEPIGLAATFDTELVEALGDVVSTEGRAKYELAQKQGNYSRYSGLTYWSPNVNIFRDPRWGRGMETYGEDPYLSGMMGSAYVRGIQGDDSVYLKAAACGKHFAVHSGPEETRHEADIYPSKRDLYETYTPAFKMLVDNGVESIMMAYNAVYGMPCPGNQLLFDILRKDFGFKGHIVSDCGAVEDIWQGHEAAKSAAEACAIAIKAGLNVECGSAFKSLQEALDQNLLTEKDINEALFPLIMTRLKLGIIGEDPACPYNHVGEEMIGCEKHISLARRAAQECMVLLKNDKNLLPLRKDIHRLYVTGEGATEVYNLMGNYYGISSRYTCYLQGIAGAVSAGTTIDYRPGCMLVTPEVNDMNWAIGDSRHSKYTIVVLGLNGNNEGEEGEAIASAKRGDRANMRLPENQLNYLRRIREEKKEGLILVLTGGSAIDMTELYDLADAIVMTWYSGQEGGLALADLIFGDANFSGRLPITFPADESKLPDITDYNMDGRTYKYMKDNIYFPFGFGLSYSKVTYGEAKALNMKNGRMKKGEPLRVSVRVTNESERDVTEVVQAYVSAPGAGVDAPIQQLVGFERVALGAGESKEVEITIPAEQLKTIDNEGHAVLRKGMYKVTIASAAPSHRDQELGVEKTEITFRL